MNHIEKAHEQIFLSGVEATKRSEYCSEEGKRETTSLSIPSIFIMMVQQQTKAPSPRRPLNGAGVRRIPGWKTLKPHKISTWNVTTLFEAGKLQNLLLEMRRLDITIMGVCETRWLDCGSFRSDGYTVFHSGNQNNIHRNGVAIIIKEELSDSVLNFIPVSDRIMLIQLNAKPVNINIIQVYAPTADKDDHEIEELYNQLSDTLKMTKKHEINIIMGDFNAKVGAEETMSVTGKYGLGERNDRGKRLIQFCLENKLTIMNTWFKLPNRRLFTWKSPQDGHQNRIVRNQIDYIIINHRFRNNIKAAKTYPGADINSNHNLLCSTIKVQLKRKIIPKTQRMPLEILRDNKIRDELAKKLNEDIHNLDKANIENNTINENWTRIKTPLLRHQTDITGSKRKRKNKWMTDEILDLMDKRRTLKNKNLEKYVELNRTIRRKIKEAKERWLEESCKEIERLEKSHDLFNLHKKLKTAAGIHRNRHTNLLKDEQGNLLTDTDQRCEQWEKYIANLFKDDTRPELEVQNKTDEHFPILISEVEKAIKQSKSNKTPGPDQIPIELLKLLDNDSIRHLTKFYNQVYRTCALPDDWLESLFITLPKKNKATKCSDFRLISLMSHSLKILLKIIQNRIYKHCEEELSDEQFGFRNGLGTREALFGIRLLIQKICEFRKNVFVCFIDFEKAFDQIYHGLLFRYLNLKEINKNDLRLLEYLYYNQVATIKVDEKLTKKIPIKRGVRQGCVLSPTLFNVYSEEIFKESIMGRSEGVKIGGEIINNIRYADDTAILAETLEDLQTLLNLVNEESNQRGLRINVKKTKWMVAGKIEVGQSQLLLNGQPLERVTHFKYLGSWINENGDSDEEILTRIALARKQFISWNPVLCNRNLSMHIRKRVLKCYIWSVLLYGCEAWTLKASIINKLEAFELWCYRRILRIPWVAHTTNEDVLAMINTERQLVNIIKTRKTEYFGHIIRGPKYCLLRQIIQGKVEGRRWIGRKKLSWLRNIRQWTGLQPEQLFRAAADRDRFHDVIHTMNANV